MKYKRLQKLGIFLNVMFALRLWSCGLWHHTVMC